MRGALLNNIATRLIYATKATSASPARRYHNMADIYTELTAPNGRKYTQPLGLFINNEFVKSKSGEKITSLNPT